MSGFDRHPDRRTDNISPDKDSDALGDGVWTEGDGKTSYSLRMRLIKAVNKS